MSEFGRRRRAFRRKAGPRGRAVTTRRYRRKRRIMNVRTGGYQGIERKFVDIETQADAFATTWATMEDATNDSISGVAQGDGESQRDGRKYWIHSIHIKCAVQAQAQEAQVNPLSELKGRICLVWDKQTNGAQLTATDVMDGGLTDDTLAFRNLQFTSRFQVLWDKKWKLTRHNVAQGAVDLFAATTQTTHIMTYNKIFSKPVQVICSGTTAVIANITDNSFHIIGVATNTTALLNMQVRVRFTS